MNVISKAGLNDLLNGKSQEVRTDALAWFAAAKAANWSGVASVRRQYPDADLVGELLVFNIRHNRYRLIVYPVFLRGTLYIKALLDHKEYDRGEWRKKWP